MTNYHPLAAPAFSDPQDVERFRDALSNADFTATGIVTALRIKNLDAIRTAGRPVLLDRTSGGRPIDTFIRLFLLRVPVTKDELKGAVGPLSLDSFLGSRLAVQVEGGSDYVSGFDLLPFEGFTLCFDRPPRDGREPYTDYVMGVGGSTAGLAMQMVRRKSRATLDLGCGCGTLGFIASRFSDRVVFADRNPRALEFTRFNVALNGIQNAEVVETDFFSAVKGRKFDLIVSNPPFVISPGKTFIYRDGGMERDGVTETVVRGCCEHLADDGFAHILCNWAHLKGIPWEQRLAGWVESGEADMLVLRTITRDPVEYAMQWLSETERHLTTEQMWQRFGEWVEAYRSMSIEAISGGLISLHKSTGRKGWFDVDTGPEQTTSYTGEHLARMFAARDFLAGLDGMRGLAMSRVRCSPSLRLTQHVKLTDEGWRLIEAEVKIEPGYPFGGVLEHLVMQFVLKMDGTLTVGEAINAVAQEHGTDPAKIGPRAISIVEHLIKRGVLIPVA
jgi:methylase of polypeptide subunit release factors